MYSKIVEVKNPTGLHARPAAMFIAEAKKYASAITLHRVGEESTINAKSMVKLLTLGICQGQQIEICAEGTDEQDAVDALIALIEEGFDE